MIESRIVATERLRREGRWEEASAYREEVRRDLRVQKKPRAEANDAAWDAMIAKFPPLPIPVPENLDSVETSVEEEADDFAALVDRMQDNPPDLDRDALWAYEHLDVRGVTPDAAPSLGAWGLLKWARGNRNRFFEQALPKAAISRQKRHEANDDACFGDGEVEDPGIEEIAMMIRKRLLQEKELFIADAPKEISLKVRDALSDWTRCSGLVASADALADLTSSIITMTGHCVEAALARPEEYKRNNAKFRAEISCKKV